MKSNTSNHSENNRNSPERQREPRICGFQPRYKGPQPARRWTEEELDNYNANGPPQPVKQVRLEDM